jgi:ATP-dependent DNA ligase
VDLQVSVPIGVGTPRLLTISPPQSIEAVVDRVEPKLLAEIEYRAKSAEGKVRHPFFKGLRDDLGESR